ncbi:MAG: choice-of-anchor Q domain-containing protein, partial [Candidatus Neomarinimicrobiota bacterium]
MIIENNYGSSGGAMWVSPSRGSIKLLSSIVRNNTGTAIWGNGLNDATFEIVNTLIYDNEGGAYGYGNFNAGNGLKVVNCTVVNNNGSSPNGGAFALNNGNLEVINSIIYNNQPTDITTVGSYGNITVNNSIITNDENSVTVFYPSEAIQLNWSDNHYGVNPSFTDVPNEDYSISDYSIAIGKGTSSGAPITDISGNARPNPEGTNPDIGAYENSLGTTLTFERFEVDIMGTKDFTNISSAINASSNNDTVIVYPGTYSENITLNKGIILISEKGADSTIIDAQSFGTVLTISENLTEAATVDGFTLKNGNTLNGQKSGGLNVLASASVDIRIKNCIITDNQSHQGGG